MVKRKCYGCKHYNKSFGESPCAECVIEGNRKYWEPNENPYWERICEISEKQRAKGMSKYGMGLENNSESILTRIRYIEEELIDGLMYLEWLKDALAE